MTTVERKVETIKYNVSYDECIEFIEKELNRKLFDYEKLIIRCFIDGKRVRVPRGAGRSMLVKVFAKFVSHNNVELEKYVIHLLDKNDYLAKYLELPEIVIPWQTVVESGVLSQKFIDEIKSDMSPREFDLFFCDNTENAIERTMNNKMGFA